ncbi:NnrU family protein, partial [Asticcacaulis sp. W401b]|uniref:NnrU family protein n=1 Tax=Asticcacaulis sp. W401b TaxID=3388666 RepID=UPI00397071CE
LAYSLVSLGVLAWLIVAAGRAPYVEVWAPAPWQRWVPFLMMPIVFVLVACAVGKPNPLSFGGWRNEAFDPAYPGIAGVVRHPILWALFLWAAAHLIPNGDLAHVILFGLFALFAFTGQRAVDKRMKRRLSAGEWEGLAANTSSYPFTALFSGRWAPDYRKFPSGRVGTGLLLFVLVLYAHQPMIGLSPFPS